MLDNNKTLHFRAFPTKTLDSIFHKSSKTLFLAKKSYRQFFFIRNTKSKSVNITVFEKIKNLKFIIQCLKVSGDPQNIFKKMS